MAADDEDIAEDALSRIQVEYEEWPAVLAPFELTANARAVLERGGGDAAPPLVNRGAYVVKGLPGEWCLHALAAR